ncbi:MAG TPA: MASE1 domain-containing protein [Polyangia bacterium]|jgi:signal transduction histidine kinase|nr:MASE1 domain-containing protein [Polyangia bacterium]
MLDRAGARIHYAVALVAVLVIYAATAKLGLRFDALAGVATTVWPPTGIALAAICLGGRRLWPAIFLAALAVNASTDIPAWAAVIIATGNTAEAVLAAKLLGLFGWRRQMDRMYDVLIFAVTALLATTVSATLGTIAIRMAHIPVADGYGLFWTVWWVGDVLGALLIAPAIFAWSDRRAGWPPSRRPRHWVEALLLAGGLVLVSAAVFSDLFPQKLVRLARGTYSIWPLLIWAVIRFRLRGTTLALLLVSVVAISGTASGHGLFAGGTLSPTAHERLFRVQCFMAVTAVSMMCLAAALAERRQAILARDEFISIASHELKTPLTALRLRLGTALRLLGGDRGPSPSGSAPSAEGIERSARALVAATATTDRLGRLVDDLLDVSRLTAHRLELTLEEVTLSEMLADLAGRLREQAAETGSTISIMVDQPSHPLVGVWDRGRVEQVITNLLSNAVKYGAGQAITVDARGEGDRVVIVVRDRGIGIAKADQERIFHAFERVETVHRVGGLGLGLYIGRQIVAAHGGTLRVSSDPGQGSTFVLDLPRLAHPQAARLARES